MNSINIPQNEVHVWKRSFEALEKKELSSKARSFLLETLSQYLGCNVDQITLNIGEHGKPFTQGIHFNLSHSHGEVWLGIANRPIGIDVEKCKNRPNWKMLAQRFFSENEYAFLLDHKDDAEDVFYQIWTLKEALLKGRGVGLSGGLKEFSVVMTSGFVDSCSEWSLYRLDPPTGFKAALAVENTASLPLSILYKL